MINIISTHVNRHAFVIPLKSTSLIIIRQLIQTVCTPWIDQTRPSRNYNIYTYASKLIKYAQSEPGIPGTPQFVYPHQYPLHVNQILSSPTTAQLMSSQLRLSFLNLGYVSTKRRPSIDALTSSNCKRNRVSNKSKMSFEIVSYLCPLWQW
jgi:hypothetical protein